MGQRPAPNTDLDQSPSAPATASVFASIMRVVPSLRAGRVNSLLARGNASPPPSVEDSVALLSDRLKRELRERFDRGERPTAAEYLEKYPELAANKDKVLSLVYEEFCLLEDKRLSPNPTEFCERYSPWTKSLRDQLQFHQMFSQLAEPPTALPRFPAPEEKFDTFRILSEIGQGGAARVYLASNEELGGREVVLKVSADRGIEASIHGRLEHQHIVPVYSVSHQRETQLRALCMPYRPGLSLDKVIQKLGGTLPTTALAIWKTLAPESPEAAGRFPTSPPDVPGWKDFPVRGSYEEGVAWIIERVARALHYAHGKGIHHRDVKPANIMLTRQEGPQLIDFNLANTPDSPEQAALTLRGGTLPYMAPEQLDAFRRPERWNEVGVGSDIYSLGLVMRELLTIKPPVVQSLHKSPAQTIHEFYEQRMLSNPWPSPRECNPKVPHALEAIVNLCLRAAPSSRYPSAEALARDLDQFLHHKPLDLAQNPSSRERLRNWKSRHTIALRSAAALALLACGYGAWSFQRWMIPFEQRAAFVNAVQRLEANKFGEARVRLNALLKQGDDFPLLWIYLAGTYSDSPIPETIQDKLETVWHDKAAVAELDDWSKTHPKFLGTVEQISLDLFAQEGRDQKNPQRADWKKALAEIGIAFVNERDPSRKLSMELQAIALEKHKDFEKAHTIFSILLEPLKGKSSQADLKKVLPYLQARARISSKWIENQLARKDPKLDLGAISSRVVETLNDLERHAQIVDSFDKSETLKAFDLLQLRYECDYIRCVANVNAGDLSSRLGQEAKARLAYKQAARYLIEISPIVLEADFFTSLKNRVLDRLARTDASREPLKPFASRSPSTNASATF